MTREEAIKMFNSMIEAKSQLNACGVNNKYDFRVGDSYFIALEMAIKALKQEPCEQIKWERDTAIAQLKELGYGLGEKPKTGHWKRISIDKYSQHAMYWYRCDRCGEDNLGDTDWCSNCGAKMESGDKK